MNTMLKRVLSLLLCIVLATSCLPVSAFATDGGEGVTSENTEVSTIITMSDYQNSSLSSEEKKTVPQTIVNAMVSAGVTPELALIGGDYTDGSVGADGDDQSQASLKTELGNLTGILTNAWSNLPYYAIQGNHDHSVYLTDGTLDATGAYERDNYIVYLINEDDFPWWQGDYNYDSGSNTAEDKATVTATANALRVYLDTLDGSKPVIIMSHVPMHWSVRSTNTAWYYDNIYANILFEVVNEAAKKLDILFLFGHNHSSTASGGDYDYEIGGALAYVAKGESMKVPNGTDGTSNYTTEMLNFTYMNSGYVGKYAGNIGNCSISAITIDDDSIDIARYTYNGDVYNATIALTGGSGNSSNNSGSTEGEDTDGDNTGSGDATIIDGWVTISGSSASAGGFEKVASLSDISSTEKYIVVVWRYFGNNPNEEGYVFHDKNNSNIKVTTSDGCATVTSSSGTIDDGCYWYITNNGNGTITMKNAGTGFYLGSNIVANSNSAVNLTIASATYNGYQNFAIGYNDGAIRYSNSSSSFTFSSNTTSSGASSANACNITIYKQAMASEGTPDTYARLSGETVQSYDANEATSATAVLGKLSIETSTDGSAVAETVSVTSDMVTWDKTFNGSNIGTYTGTVTYEGQTLGTVIVNVTGTAEEVTGNGDWVQVSDGETTYTYTQATSITAGGKYVIVGDKNAVALMDNSGFMGSQSVTISGSTMTSTTALTEWTFEGPSSGTIHNGDRYLYYSRLSFSLNSSNSTNFNITANGSNFRIQKEGYSFYYNGSSWTCSNRKTAEYVRLYQLTNTITSNKTYARLTGTLEQVYSNADATTEATVLGKVNIQTSTDQSTVASTVAVTSDMVTWDTTFNGSVAGTYTGTVKYEGQTMGTIKVTVTPVSVETIELITPEGAVVRGSSKSAATGGKLKVTYSDGTTKEVDITLGMLNNNGKTVGIYSDLTVTYGGKNVDGFTLTVTQRAGNNYPEYPNEGAVKVNKTATGIDFQSSGVAQVELSVSGVPMNQGIDIVIVLDTSSSMQETVDGFSSSRLAILRPALNNLIKQLQTKREDGSDPNLDVSIVCFNGFTGNGNSSTKYGSDNYIEAQAYATPNSGGLLTDESGDGWVDIMDLSTNWADENKGNIDTGSGTNYDEGLLLAYEQLAAKQEANALAGETRQQFVIFMSDGAPFQYNGVYSNYTSSEWNNWLLGNYQTEDVIPNTVTNKEYYTGYAAGQGQDHRIAEAIKGNPEKEYQIVTTTADTNGKTELTTVYGLGATMYSIGYLLADNGQVTDETQDIVLKNIASGDEYYYDVDTAAELDNAFTDFAGAVLMSAYNAYFDDQMGSAFDIQLKPVNYLPEGVTDWANSKTITPTIEIKAYDIYTRQDWQDGNCTKDQVGDRKKDTDGNYIYTVIEKVTFTYNFTENTEGQDEYILTGAVSDQVGTDATNILADGVINGKYFIYNMNSTAVTVDGITVEAESFHWEVGTVTTNELAISYYVYLTDSLEGARKAGSYDTNTYAKLYYENYLGNDCYKDTVSPSLAWESALVKYAFYLVDSNGNPVNANGTVVTFANKVAVTQPVTYQEILLNNDESVNSISVASLGNLPEGYTLYDDAAVYTVTINSNSTGNWVITKGKETATTYVMQYDPDHASAYSNELNETDTSYDYTHTIVWFAVVWTPQCIPDTVVIDYGLPVDITVLNNDMFGDDGKLVGVSAGVVSATENTVGGVSYDTTNKVTGTENVTGSYGAVEIITTDTSGNQLSKNEQVVRYTPTTMAMDTYDRFTYSVYYNGDTNNGYYYGTVTVIPATTIYYEDTFITFAGSNNGIATSGIAEKTADGLVSGQWYREGITDADATQAEDRPGYYSLSYIDANNVYGYDGAYAQMSKYSLDSAVRVHVDSSSYATAGFSFYGTGFDVISLTSNTTGTIVVQVYKDGIRVRNTLVDTFYGMEEDGSLSVNSPESIYQVPVIKISGLEYAKYDVTITATYNTIMDHTTADGYDLYLDAIRIYDPAGTSYGDDGNDGATGSEIDDVIEEAYIADGEGYPVYTELRNNIIKASNYTVTENEDGTVTVSGSNLTGAIFIDCNDEVTSIADYVSYGPNNEVYLAKNQAIAFKVNVPENVADVQLGIKMANGSSVTYKINGDSYTVSTATDMYYSILKYAKAGTVTIKNISEGILSLTNIKVTHTSAPATETGISLLSMDAESAGFALMSLRSTSAIEEEVPETTKPEENVPGTDESEEDNSVETIVAEVVETVKNIVKKLFGWLFG